MAASLCEEYRAELQPDGGILLVPEDYSRPTYTNPDIKSEALRVLWRMRSSQMSRRDMAYLLPDLDSTVSWADVAPWLKHLSQPASRRVCILEGEYEMQWAYCNIAERLALLYEARAVRTPEALQPGAQRNTWVTIGVDGTNRWNRAYVHCAVAAPGCGPTQLASWWLFEGSEMWATVYNMQSECDFDTQLRAATALQLPHADGVARSPVHSSSGPMARPTSCWPAGTASPRSAPGPWCATAAGQTVKRFCVSSGDKRLPWKESRDMYG